MVDDPRYAHAKKPLDPQGDGEDPLVQLARIVSEGSAFGPQGTDAASAPRADDRLQQGHAHEDYAATDNPADSYEAYEDAAPYDERYESYEDEGYEEGDYDEGYEDEYGDAVATEAVYAEDEDGYAEEEYEDYPADGEAYDQAPHDEAETYESYDNAAPQAYSADPVYEETSAYAEPETQYAHTADHGDEFAIADSREYDATSQYIDDALSAAAPAHAGAAEDGLPSSATKVTADESDWQEIGVPAGETAPDPELVAGIAGMDSTDKPSDDESVASPHMLGEEQTRRASGRSRRGMMTVLTLFGLAIVGVAGATGYRMFSSGGSAEPPLITASLDGVKVRPPAKPKTTDSTGKVVYDQISNDKSADKKTTDGEAQTAKKPATRVILPAPSNQIAKPAPKSATPADPAKAVQAKPRKVRTVIVRPDGTIIRGNNDAKAAPKPAAEPKDTTATAARQPKTDATVGSTTAAAPKQPQSGEEKVAALDAGTAVDSETTSAIGAADTAADSADAPPMPVLRPTRVASRTATSTPKAAARKPAPKKQAAKPEETGPVALVKPDGATEPKSPPKAAPAPKKTGPYMVQVSSQRSREKALVSFRDLQRRFPSLLKGQEPDIKRVNLGDRGIYYRVRVAGGSRSEAASFCTRMKSAGGDCLIQRR